MVDRVRDLIKGPRPNCGNRRAASEGESAPDAESCGRDSAPADGSIQWKHLPGIG
jgi:hypothetical protein